MCPPPPRQKWKDTSVPEKWLLLLAFIGGAYGCLAGMFKYRHKTRKPIFTVVFGLTAVATAYLLWTVIGWWVILFLIVIYLLLS